MPFDGTGIFSRIYSWQTDQANGVLVRADRMDTDSNDIASGLSNCITKDGQQTITANIPFSGYKITGLGNGAASTDAVNFGQVFTAPRFSGGVTVAGGLTVSSGAVAMASATSVTAPTPPAGDNSTKVATTAFAVGLAFAAALPAQTGNAGKFVTTDGSTASWALPIPAQAGNAGKFLTTDGTTASWVAEKITRSARTSNTMLVGSDAGNLIDITSGTFSQTFDAAATLGSGWYCYIRNSGTGDITLDPNAAETIDGLTSFIMYPGEARLVQCDGTALRSVVIQPFYRAWTASGTFTTPPGYSYFGGLAWSAGASGQKSGSAATAACGGHGGGCFPFQLPASSFGTSQTITIGAGGLAVTTTANGNAGGDTSIGSLLVVGGSSGSSSSFGGAVKLGNGNNALGAYNGSGNSSTADGFGSVYQSSSYGHTVYGGSVSLSSATNASGSTVYGGAAGGSVNSSAVVQAAGSSRYGGNGGAASSAGNGTDGVAPGGGGGATQTGAQSGAGARGELRLWGIV